jgi:hypothetical protein
VIRNRKEVINLTLGANKTRHLVSRWHVSDEPSLSDYRYICFQIDNIAITRVILRDPTRTNWESYKDNLGANLENMSQKICMIQGTGLSGDQLQHESSHPSTVIVQPGPLTCQGA